MAVDPERGFTSDVIRDPERFVGRTDLIKSCISAVNSQTGLIGVYGKRGVGKSSLMRQIQQLALGDYLLPKRAGIGHLIPEKPLKYLTVYYSCDSLIENSKDLLARLCNDQDEEDGLLRLVPNDGKELSEFTRSKEVHGGADLKVVNWGTKGIESSKYARIVPGDIVQTFRNFVSSIVSHQVKKRMKRDALLILLDEFDVIKDKSGIGSLFKSLTTSDVKFGICGIGNDLSELVSDHASVERLLEQGILPVKPMLKPESEEIITRATELYEGRVIFTPETRSEIASLCQGYPYFVQLIGKQCIHEINVRGSLNVDMSVYKKVLADLKSGIAFPTLERAYQRAIGNSRDRQLLLHLLADQSDDNDALFTDETGRIILRDARADAEDLEVQFIDQLMPRLIDARYGPVLQKPGESRGVYEFVNPVLRQYIRLRDF